MITAEAHNSTLWLYCDLKKYIWSIIIIMKHSISFIHISEKNLTFEGISDAIEYVCVFLLELHYFSLSHTVCEVTQYNCKL